MNTNIIPALILGVSLILGSFLYANKAMVISSSETSYGTVRVQAQGTAKAIPDTALLTAGVQIQKAETQESAYSEMNKTVNTIQDILKKSGIQEKNIQTSRLSVTQSFDYRDGAQTPNGYNAYQSMTIRIEQKEESVINAVLDEISKVPNLQIDGVSFESLNTDEVLRVARADALLKAKNKALDIAKSTNVKLGKVLSVSETNSENRGGPVYPMLKNESMDDSVGGGANIQSGELEYSVGVEVVYQIN